MTVTPNVRQVLRLSTWTELGSLTPFLKQLPTLALYTLAVAVSLFVPFLPVSNLPALLSGMALMLIVTGLAWLLTVRPSLSALAVIVPAADFAGVALLRYSTGESTSIYSSLVILPVVWLASQKGRRYIAYAALGAAFVFLFPLILAGDLIDDPVELLRAFYNPLSFGVAAAVINELSRRSRVALFQVRQREGAAKRDLARAAMVQRALLPKDGAVLDGYQLAGACIPSRSVGGDFFDWYPVSGGVALTLGDVMGKGVGAGMVAATARSVVRGVSRHPEPSFAMEKMAECLEHDLVDAQTFMTMFHGRLDADTGAMRFCDAGHGLTLVVRPDGTHERLLSEDRPVGMIPDDAWNTQTVTLNPGDILVSFSDGVLDLYDGTLLAIGEVAKLLGGVRSADDAVEAVSALARTQQNDDDVTVVALRRDDLPQH